MRSSVSVTQVGNGPAESAGPSPNAAESTGVEPAEHAAIDSTPDNTVSDLDEVPIPAPVIPFRIWVDRDDTGCRYTAPCGSAPERSVTSPAGLAGDAANEAVPHRSAVEAAAPPANLGGELERSSEGGPRKSTTTSWRAKLTVHPAADLFPPLSESELLALGENIKKNGLKAPVALLETDGELLVLDGRSRLDAMELVGMEIEIDDDRTFLRVPDTDPVGYVISANIHRRHLNTRQKRELIAKLLKLQPENSNRQIAAAAHSHHETVAAVRAEGEQCGEIRHVKTRADTLGRKQPTTKPKSRRVPPSDRMAPAAPVAAAEAPKSIGLPGAMGASGVGLAPGQVDNIAAGNSEHELLKSFCVYTIRNIAGGHLKISGEPEPLRQWNVLKEHVAMLLSGIVVG
jgi:hypothetical protein